MNSLGLRAGAAFRPISRGHRPLLKQLVSRRDAHKLVPLPYDSSKGLGNFMSKETLEMVSVEYQQGLLHRLTDLVKGTPEETLSPLACVINLAQDRSKVLAFNYASQALNNSFFLDQLAPPRETNGNASETSSEASQYYGNEIGIKQYEGLRNAINDAFGDLSQLKSTFSAAATGMFGSGWVWLVCDRSGRLAVVATYGPGTVLVRSREHRGMRRDVLGSDITTSFDTHRTTPALPMSRHSYYNQPTSAKTIAQNALRSGIEPDRKRDPATHDLAPLLACSIHEHCWVRDHGVWGKESYLKYFWEVVDWNKPLEHNLNSPIKPTMIRKRSITDIGVSSTQLVLENYLADVSRARLAAGPRDAAGFAHPGSEDWETGPPFNKPYASLPDPLFGGNTSQNDTNQNNANESAAFSWGNAAPSWGDETTTSWGAPQPSGPNSSEPTACGDGAGWGAQEAAPVAEPSPTETVQPEPEPPVPEVPSVTESIPSPTQPLSPVVDKFIANSIRSRDTHKVVESNTSTNPSIKKLSHELTQDLYSIVAERGRSEESNKQVRALELSLRKGSLLDVRQAVDETHDKNMKRYIHRCAGTVSSMFNKLQQQHVEEMGEVKKLCLAQAEAIKGLQGEIQQLKNQNQEMQRAMEEKTVTKESFDEHTAMADNQFDGIWEEFTVIREILAGQHYFHGATIQSARKYPDA
ncbi:hypothetical protein FRB99_002364 [Tulasnella sp. 403]|nr:hypothetical protein FRB99_002364 [Tulasnella sp. 403]